MTLRTRILLAFGVAILIPLVLLAFGLRQEMNDRLTTEYQIRVDNVVQVIREDLHRESAGISERLASLKNALLDDNGFRRAAVVGMESDRHYLLDYAGSAMRLTGLSMLQIQDEDGRIVSSGHFRNEHGRIEPGIAKALADIPGVALLTTFTPEREFLALARSESFHVGGRRFSLIGGIAVDETFLANLARDRAIVVSLNYAGVRLSSNTLDKTTTDATVGRPLEIPLIRTGSDGPPEVVSARLEVRQP